MQRVVHLDFKGAPPRLPFLEQILVTLRSKGTTSVILEWEDTFPYSGELTDIGSIGGCGGDGVYTIGEVKHIFQFCRENGLRVIQTIPIIYQMEFVLKHALFKNLRRDPKSPSEININNPAATELVHAMLDQMLDVQSDALYFLLGPIAVCRENLEEIDKTEQKIKEYVEFIKDTTLFLKQKRPNLTVLVRDDFFKTLSFEELAEYRIGDLVEPVVCNFKEYFNTDADLWNLYRLVFPRVWAGSVYRGVDGGNMIFSESYQEANNHESWRREIEKYSSVVYFAGIVLVGFSRYDHYGTLCELLPVSLPHIEVCYNVLQQRGGSESALCQFPGSQMSTLLYNIDATRNNCLCFINSEQVATWLNPWQIKTRYTSASQVQGLVNKGQLYALLCDLVGKQNELIRYLNDITGQRSAGEWIGTYITPIVEQLSELLSIANERCKAGPSIKPACI